MVLVVTWGRLIDVDTATFLDRNDPNYDSNKVILHGLDLYTPVIFSCNAEPFDFFFSHKKLVNIIFSFCLYMLLTCYVVNTQYST